MSRTMYGVTYSLFTDSQAFDKMNRLRYILALALLVSFTTAPAQNGIELKTPERIARMLESMPMDDIPTEGQFRCPELSSTIIFYTQARDGVTVQLGARLFSDQIRNTYDPVIISFTERLWVELLLRKTTTSQTSLLKEYGVRIVLGGYPLGSGSFTQLSKALDVLNSLTSLSITTGGNEIDMFMRDQAGSTMHIYIPASRDLLFPYDKKEHEEVLVKDLFDSKAQYNQTIPESTDFVKTDNGLLAVGGECYMIDSLTNDVFYTSDRKILFNQAYPDETMRNMLMCAANKENVHGKRLNIRLHTYNKELGVLTMSMEQVLAYFQQQGVKFFTGNLGDSGNKHQCLLAMYHPVYNYINILSVSYLPEQLDQTGITVIDADLSVFIPQHNIKNLFQEK